MLDDDTTCVICVDVYKDPRLLPCGHTYCLECLEKWHVSSGQKNFLLCPVCREATWLSDVGIFGLICNYFVPNRLLKSSCKSCQKLEIFRCNVCNGNFCRSCLKSHGPCFTSANDRDINFESDDGLPENNITLRETFSILRQVTRTCCPADCISRFSCQGTSDKESVNKIVPVSETEAWILCDGESIVSKYHISGVVIDRRRASGKVIDISVHPDGPLLAIEENSNSVWICGEINTSPVEFVNLGTYFATCLLVREDRSLIVGVKKIIYNQYTECFLIFFDQNRQLQHSKKLNTSGVFQTISDLTYDYVSNRICVIDRRKAQVHVIADDRHSLTYVRSAAFPVRNRTGSDSLEPNNFQPMAITCGLQGSFFLLDCGSGFIHILNSDAKLTGVVVMDDVLSEDFPNTISVGHGGRLWIGHRNGRNVYVYNVDTFVNFLGPTVEVTGMGSDTTIFNYVSPYHVSRELFADITSVSRHPYIAVTNGPGGPNFVLQDTGSPEGNRQVFESVFRNIRRNDMLRIRLRNNNIDVDALAEHNFTFEKLPYMVRNGQVFPSGHRERDNEFLDFIFRIHPGLQEMMDRNGIFREMLINYGSQTHMFTGNLGFS